MGTLDPHFEVSVSSPDEVKEVKVSRRSSAPEPETVQGLESILITRDNGKGFKVSTLLCTKCGRSDDYREDEIKCRRCGNVLDRSKRKARDIHAAETKKILDNQLVYKCPQCGKMYDKPTMCCNKEFLKQQIKGSYEAYICPDCQSVYIKPVRCCSGRMIKGDFYPNPSTEMMQKLSSPMIAPVDIAIL